MSTAITGRHWPALGPTLTNQSQRREEHILSVLITEIGNPPLKQLRVDVLEVWWARCCEVRSPGTANKYCVRLKHLCSKLHAWGYLPQNPARFLKKMREPQGRVTFLTTNQRQLLFSLANPRLRLYMLVAHYSGARRSSIAGLRWRDIDFTNDLITFPLTKNGRSHTVPLHPAIKAALSEIGPGDAAAYVLPRMTLDAVSRAFKRLATRCGMPHLRLHDMRHDCASSLAMAWANQAVIMAVLGHRDPRMSARYTHLADQMVRDAMVKGLC